MKQWDRDATFGSDILGNGSCFGNLTGKVKTKQIGFLRNDRVSKVANVSKKTQIQPKTGTGRSGKNK